MTYNDLSSETLRAVLAIDNAINQGFHGVSQPQDGSYLDTFWQIGREYGAAVDQLEARGLRASTSAGQTEPTVDHECEALSSRLERIAQRRFAPVDGQVLSMAEAATLQRCAELLRLIPGLLEIKSAADRHQAAAHEEAALHCTNGTHIDPPILTEVVTLRVGTLGWFASLQPSDRQSAYHLVCAGQAMRAKKREDGGQWDVIFTGTSLVVGTFPSMSEACAFAEAWNCQRLAPNGLPPLADVLAIGLNRPETLQATSLVIPDGGSIPSMSALH